MRVLVGALVAASFCASANASEFIEACEAKLVEEGREPIGCACLEAELKGDAALAAEFETLAEIASGEERYKAASDHAKAAMDKCTR